MESSPIVSKTGLQHMADAQTLNNTAAFDIQNENYEKAIVGLEKALRLWEEYRLKQTNGKSYGVLCVCRECTLDGCITFSDEQTKHYLSNQCRRAATTTTLTGISEESSSSSSSSSSRCGSKRRRISIHKYIETNEDEDRDDASTTTHHRRKNQHQETASTSDTTTDDDTGDGFIYRQPIQIPKCHNIGSTCFFVIMFNLALANHLKALDDRTNGNDSIQNVMFLYELIFEYWSRLQADCSVARGNDAANSSLRFLMILFNNLSQVYRITENTTKQGHCLHNLLSIVMIAVESNTRLPQNDCRNEAFQQSIDGFLTNALPPKGYAEAA